jgi:hypothetical protein
MSLPSPQLVAHARRLYIDGVPIAQIIAQTGINETHLLYRMFDGDFPDGSGKKPAALPRRRIVVRRLRKSKAGVRQVLTERLWRAADRQMRDMEKRLVRADQEPPERESDARMLGVLVKTLRDLAAFDANAQRKQGAAPAPDDIPLDVDELRRELARRVDLIRQRRNSSGTGGNSSA